MNIVVSEAGDNFFTFNYSLQQLPASFSLCFIAAGGLKVTRERREIEEMKTEIDKERCKIKETETEGGIKRRKKELQKDVTKVKSEIDSHFK